MPIPIRRTQGYAVTCILGDELRWRIFDHIEAANHWYAVCKKHNFKDITVMSCDLADLPQNINDAIDALEKELNDVPDPEEV